MKNPTIGRGLLVLGVMAALAVIGASSATANDELCDGYEDAPFCQGDSVDDDYHAPSTDDCVTDWDRAECEVRCYHPDTGERIDCPDYVTDGQAPNEPEADDEVHVLATATNASAAESAGVVETLPNTGVGTVLLALLGMVSVVSGAWLVRR